ncbi:hypothetical protein [Halorientalis persicus]|nr:hypothetical protein [Halorientalis persicus]
MPDDPSEFDISVDAVEGRYRQIRNDVEKKLPRFHRKVSRLAMDGLTIDGVVDAVIDHFEIRKQAEPQVAEFIEDYFEERALVERQVKAAVRDLVDRILYTSEENKGSLLSQMRIEKSQYHEMQKTREDIEYATDGWIQEEDFCILLDAVYLAKSGEVDKLVTGDGGYLHAENVMADRYDLSLIWAESEFYSDDLVYSEKESEDALKSHKQQ